MKKTIVLCVIGAIVVLGFLFRSQVKPHLNALKEKSGAGQIIENLAQEISTGGALRAKFDAPNPKLTVDGVVQWTNAQRGQHSLPALKTNRLLEQSAQKKVEDMFNAQYFEHESPQGVGPGDLAKGVGYVYVAIGENLALGNYKDDEALVQAWMDSPGHRANILNSRYTEIGVAVGQGMYEGKKVWLAVQEFGRPASDCPSINESQKQQIAAYQTEAHNLEAQLATLKAELNSMGEPQTESEYEAYNQKVREYNATVKVYNNKVDLLKQVTEAYNAQVKAFNECVKK